MSNGVEIPIPGEGVDEMAEGIIDVPGDIDQDCAELILESVMAGHEADLAEITANAETAYSIVRFSGARKFNREDPMEAAAAEVILKKKT